MTPPARDEPLPIAIIGAGFAGIGMAVRLLQAGIRSFTLLERGPEIGGTWRDNTYPGAACDVPSHVYSYSFEPNPGWSRTFSPSEEIQAYLLRVVEKWQLRRYLRLGVEITDARFDEAAGRWTLGMASGEEIGARVVVSAVGGLVDPSLPDIKGLHGFRGDLFHTARWDHRCELAGRDVAVIGTGASSVQVVPAIAPEVGRLRVFQRTPAWVIPRLDKAYSERAKRWLARAPGLLRASRLSRYWLSEAVGPLVYLDSPRLSAVGEKASRMHLERSVRDPKLREKLMPRFQFGCKRILISDDYWSSFERENVELVTEPIEQIHADSIETVDGRRRRVDALVMATGFSPSLARPPIPVAGRGGRTLAQAWRDGAVAYKGMTVSGFPNWFILMGPNTGPGHTSVLVFTEAQIAHVLRAIAALRRRGLKFLDVKRRAMERYDAGIQRRMRHCVWTSGCNSWYLSEDGTNRALYPGPAAEYALRARLFRLGDYEAVGF